MPKLKANGYCLKDPHGNLLTFTFGATKDDCWSDSFEYLFGNYDWMQLYWKKVKPSIQAAKRKGFIMVPVHLSEVEKG